MKQRSGGTTGEGARYGEDVFRLTVVSAAAPLLGAAELAVLAAAGLQVVQVQPAAAEAVDPAAVPDLLLLDWRTGVPSGQPAEAAVWPGAARLALLQAHDLPRLSETTELDDFLVTPPHPEPAAALPPAFPVEELTARIRQVLARQGRSLAQHTLAAGDLIVDTANYQVVEGGRAVSLTFKEFELLRFLMTHQQQVCTRETLLNRVWGYNYYGGSRTVDVHVRRLRSKLESGGRRYVETVRNVGYRFSVPLR